MPSLYISLGALAIVLVVFSFTAHFKSAAAITIVAFGAAGFAAVPALQTRTIRTAPDSSVLASAANIAAFNVGNAAGAWLGGAAISAGLGYAAPDRIGALLAVAGLCVAVLSARHGKEPTAPPHITAPE